MEQIDATNKMVSINGENVEGWMPAMTMLYKIDKPATLNQLHVGDEISATVFDGDFSTLHDVKIAESTK